MILGHSVHWTHHCVWLYLLLQLECIKGKSCCLLIFTYLGLYAEQGPEVHSISVCGISLMILTVLENPMRHLKTTFVAGSAMASLWQEVIKTVSGSRVTHP